MASGCGTLVAVAHVMLRIALAGLVATWVLSLVRLAAPRPAPVRATDRARSSRRRAA
jgi:hypothetical protein